MRSLGPFAVVASLALAVYFAGAAVYLPHLFSSYATRYGAIGVVFALISALFGFMVVLVASAALGREVFDELGRIRAGGRPPDDGSGASGTHSPRGALALADVVGQRGSHPRQGSDLQ